MHEVKPFFEFARGIFAGLKNAVKTDVDVFLLTLAALIWPFKIMRGFFTSTIIYVIIRRIDGLMSAFLSIKRREMSQGNVSVPPRA